MFLLYINDLASVSNNCDFILFADDTTVLFHNKSVEPLIITMSRELNVIAEWYISNKLALNIKKTCILSFFVRKPLLLPLMYVSNSIIPCVSHTKFLGVIIDSQLNWTSQVNFICNKLSQCVYMLRICADCIPLCVRRLMYFAFAQSFLTNEIECWSNTNKINLNRITVLQKRLIRYMCCLHHLSHCAPHAANNKILFVRDLYYLSLSNLAFKVFNKLPVPNCIKCMFQIPSYVYDTRAVNFNFVLCNSKLNIRHFSCIVNCIFIWNSLSHELRAITNLCLFKSRLKSNLFLEYH